MHRLWLLLLLAAGWWSLRTLDPPAPVGKDAPATEFSSARAKRHIEKIAARPHPLGTPAQAEARDYLLNELRRLGGETHVQRGTAVRRLTAASVENLLARWKGRGGGKAVLLMSHYDSVPAAPGASDAASGVAAILEAVRALRSGPPLHNDLMVLLTDGEEAGLLGAALFVSEHPWAREVGVALNFEARGSGGPAAMFETSRRNGWLIREFAAAAPHRLANSLSYEIYRLMPNDSDLTIFKRGGIAGLNFAYIEDLLSYHTMLDDVGRLQEGSLQHQGTYALSLARRLGSQDLSRVVEEDDRIYFSAGPAFLHYPGEWALPLAGLAAAACLIPLGVALRRRAARWAGLGQALLAYLATLALAPALVSVVWWLLRWLKPDYHSLAHGDTYNRSYYVAAMVLLIFAVTAVAWRLAGTRRSVMEMMAGPLLVWSVLALASAALLPGASYVFTWPLAASAAGFAVAALRGGVWWTEPSGDERARPRHALMVTLCALPAVVLLVPAIHLLWVAMGLRFSWASAVVVALLLGLLWGQVAMLGARRRWWPAGGALAIALALLGVGLATARFSPEHPGHNSVFYALDADSGAARWASADRKPDEWTAQFFPGSSRGPVPGFPTENLLNGPAPAVKLAGPEVQVVEDSIAGAARTLTLLVRSPRRGVNLRLRLEGESRVLAAEVNGKKLADPGRVIYYRGVPPEGVRVSLRMAAGRPAHLTVLDQSYGLPEELKGTYRPRPTHMIPFGGPYWADATIVARALTL